MIENLEQVTSAEQLIKKNSWVAKQVSKKKLSFFTRRFLRTVALYIFGGDLCGPGLIKTDPSRFRKYGELFERGDYPDTEGWRIVREAYASILRSLKAEGDYEKELPRILKFKL